MEFTGERYVPSVDGAIKYEHLHRYALSLEFAAGKSVLDIACGEGYGSALLARVAKSVVGVDIDPATLNYARQKYYNNNLTFLVGSCDSIPLPDHSVEVVTSFETIEHHDKHEEMMLEIKRVLTPDGLLIISSPNRFVYSDEPNYVNEHHVKELYYNELMDLLSRHFKHVRCDGQRLATGSFVFQLDAGGGEHYAAYSGDAQQLTKKTGPLPSPVYFIAVCSDSSLPETGLASVYIDGKDDLLKKLEAERLSHISQLQSQVRRHEETIAAERATYDSQLVSARQRITAQDSELERARAQLASNEAELAQRSAEFTVARNRISQQDAELERARAQLASDDAELAQRTAEIARHLDEITNLRAKVSEEQVRLAQRTAQLESARAQSFTLATARKQTEISLSKTQSHLLQKEEALDWIYTSRAWRLVGSLRRWERFAQRIRSRIPGQGNGVIVGKLDLTNDTVINSRYFEISGWAFSTEAPIKRVEAFLDDQYLAELHYKVERPDVVAVWPKAPLRCGFKRRVLLADSMAGSKLLTVRVFDNQGTKQLYLCPVQINLPSVEAEFSSSTPTPTPVEMNVAEKLRVTPLIEETDYLTLASGLNIRTSSQPVISVVIPVFNKSSYTFNCLTSIRDVLADSDLKVEIIVVDDHSTDDTSKLLAQVKGISVLTNPENLGFIDSCNNGAAAARGQYLLFLNNDTLVSPRCFEELLLTFENKADAGLVGAKLLYPDGRLQEAGGIIWNDASGWNYGRLDDPDKPEYCYLREVDYCSGACIMIPRELFNQLGGFDTRFRPAYYEDCDLAFQVRQAGYRVYYQPLAQVTHFEGVTSGTDVSKNVKSYQLINQQKLREKWSKVLKHHGESGVDPYATKERKVAKRILFLDACVLTPDQDAGSVMVFNHLKTFQSLGYKVTFAPDNLHRAEGYTANMQRIGIECLYWPQTKSIKSHLEEHGEDYDLVFMTRVDVAAKHGDDVRAHCPRARTIFNTIDLHFVREQRWAELEKNSELAQKALKRKDLELSIAAKSDCTLVVSSYEQEVLLKENSRLNVSVVPLTVEMPGRQTEFHERSGLLYIGGFQHTPNVDAVLYFVQSIYPLIKLELPDIKFYVLGSKPPDEILDLATDSSIVVTGYLEDVAPYFNRCRLSVAPLRYGAGLKGKVITSLSYGLPMVASTIACEGIGLEDETNILIADEPAEFAKKIIRLYTDATLWNRLSTAGFEKVNRDYSAAATRSYFEQLFKSLGQADEEGVPVPDLVGSSARL
jgi:GT2 family glycosyltransferase/SAM-dependent methyltransferase